MNLRTMTLTPWQPFAGFRDLQREMSRIFDGATAADRTARFPLVNVFGNDDGLSLTAELPGIDPADLEISLTAKRLNLRGDVRNPELEGEGLICHRRERVNGSFSRSFELPFEVEESGISAKYDKGVLSIHLPRAAKSKPLTIPVTTA